MIKAVAIVTLLAGTACSALPVLADSSPGQVATCQSALDRLSAHIVRKETVRAIGGGTRVSVIPFCMGIGPIDFGNAASLGKTIGDNPVLAAALARSGFRSDGVTIIVVGNSSVSLYVHRD